ncbi:MAG: prolipoprotein diacylglyceryl transferase [Bacteroidales bacterium]|nr:prolipoprotein diacylglyceryl transferase [Bacteroidales bacterium]
MFSQLAYVTWTVNPTAFTVFGLEIRWYGVLFALTIAIGYLILSKMFRKENQSETLIDTMLWYVVLAVVVGARLGHCLFYEPAYYLTADHWIEILYIRDGGLASHGAAIAILIAVYLVARKYKLAYWYLLDRLVIVVALGGLFIRTGNLMNSEIYGHATTLPWGFLFLRNGEVMPKHPTQIYEALSYFLLFLGLLAYYIKKDGKPKEGVLFSCFLIVCFGMRFLIEFVKENQELWEDDYVLNMGQMLSLPFIATGIVLLWLSLSGKLPHRKAVSAPKASKDVQ